MPSEQSTLRIFEKLDTISERLTAVETLLARNCLENEKDHNRLHDEIAAVKKDVDELKKRHDTHQSFLDTNKGRWQLIFALISGGVLVSAGGLIARAIGIFN